MGGKGTILSCIQSSLTLCMCEYNVCIDRDHIIYDLWQGRTQDLELGGAQNAEGTRGGCRI